MITLFQFYRVGGVPNASPFCMKVETYLRMAELPYDIQFVNNPQKGPKRKLPYIKIDDIIYSDSELLIDELKLRYGDELDRELTKEQKALGTLIDIAFCERLYWVIIYLRWQYEMGWERIKVKMFEKLPFFGKLLIPYQIRKYMLKQLDQQGMGRHSLQEALQLGIKNLDALAVILGEKKYFLGDEPTTVDATAFAFLANIIYTPLEPLKEKAVKYSNIVAYCNRMWDEYYMDLPRPQA